MMGKSKGSVKGVLTCYIFVFRNPFFFNDASNAAFLCLHDFRCLVIAALLKIALQKLHFPFDVCLVIFSTPPDSMVFDNLLDHKPNVR